MPFVHNRFFQDEFQGSKKRMSQLGEEIPEEHLEGDCFYQYNRDSSPSRFTYEPQTPNPKPLQLLQALHPVPVNDLRLDRSLVSTESDLHQAASVSSKILRIRREGLGPQTSSHQLAPKKPDGPTHH